MPRRLDHLLLGVTPAKVEDLYRRMESLGIEEDDLVEQFVHGSGPGGQKVNKTANVVRLTHVPSGTSVRAGQDRSLGRNRFLARRRLVETVETQRQGTDSPQARLEAKLRKQKDRRRRRGKSQDARPEKAGDFAGRPDDPPESGR